MIHLDKLQQDKHPILLYYIPMVETGETQLHFHEVLISFGERRVNSMSGNTLAEDTP